MILALQVAMRTSLVALLVLVLGACVADVPSEYSDFGSSESDLTASERRARAAQIRDAASAAGMTQGWMLAGIAQAETGLAHCWSEATWACQGPSSPDCGGGPVIAGAGDGPCSLQQGGLGLFQFDGGTFSQTLARDGNEILRIDGNVTRAVWFVTNMVKNSSFISGVSTDAQAIDWMNGVRIDNSRWDAWISTVVRHYNGCRMSSSCWAGRYASYRDKTRDVYNEMGEAFWSTTGGGGTPPVPPSGPTIRDIADVGACSTAGAEGLSAQLAEAQRCLNPGAFVRFAPHPNITLTSDRVHPYAQASARDALHRAAASRPLSIDSAFRTVADQYVLYHSGGCGLVATPGRSLAPRPAPRGGPRIIRRRPASLSRAPPSLPLLQAAAAACLPVSGGGRGGGERCPVSQCESSHATTPPSPISVHACTRSEDTRDGKFARKEGEGGHDPDTSEGVESTSRRWLTSGPPCTPLAADHYSPTKPSKGEAL